MTTTDKLREKWKDGELNKKEIAEFLYRIAPEEIREAIETGDGGGQDENTMELTGEQLKSHYGHNIVIASYGGYDGVNFALECEKCHQVLVDTDKEL